MRVSIGVLAQVYPIGAVRKALASCGRASLRQRALPAEAMMYYVVALGLFRSVSAREVLRCLMEGLRWVSSDATLRVSGKSSISRARTHLGSAPFEALRAARARVGPVADLATRGSWYRGRRLVAFDGSTLNVPDEATNRQAFGAPGASRGRAAFPQVRLTALKVSVPVAAVKSLPAVAVPSAVAQSTESASRPAVSSVTTKSMRPDDSSASASATLTKTSCQVLPRMVRRTVSLADSSSPSVTVSSKSIQLPSSSALRSVTSLRLGTVKVACALSAPLRKLLRPASSVCDAPAMRHLELTRFRAQVKAFAAAGAVSARSSPDRLAAAGWR